MSDDAFDTPAVTRGDVARGAGLAGLARTGALIEALAQPLYIWMFGLPAYGIYVVLWGAVSLLTNVLDLSMTSALQRVVPTRASESEAHGAVKFALIVTLLLGVAAAILVTVEADRVARLFSAAPADAARLPAAVALFVWALPLWIFIEVSTSAARARRAFGPEIRLRIFWEQLARLAFAVLFFAAGFEGLGLMLAHVSSLALTALLCVPLLRRFYDLRLLIRAPVPRKLAGELHGSGFALLPANLSRRLLIDAPPLAINLMLPGAAGASAAGLFEIARKLSTVPYIVRQSFQYVLAPLSSAQAHADRAAVGPLYHFASRVSTALVVPLAGLITFTGPDILSVYRREAQVDATTATDTAIAMPIAPMVGVSQKARAAQSRKAMRLLSNGKARWPIISTMVPAGPTIASTARAAQRMASSGSAAWASRR